MQFELLGRPGEGETLELDYREFSYAGKFVMSDTGKAVLRRGDAIIAAASYSADRTDESTARIRYITVRGDRRGEGLGPKLLTALRETLLEDAYERVAIAVNNPFAYEAAYRAGFAWLGEETGLAELTLYAPAERDASTYRTGLRHYLDRETLSERERDFVESRAQADPPAIVEPP